MSITNEDRDIAFAISDTAQSLRKAFNARARHLRMTQAQYRTLIFLTRQQGITQTELARLLEIRPITLTRQLDILASHKLIERRVNPTDRRSFCLYLTPKAGPVLDEIRSIAGAIMQDCTKDLNTADKTQMTRLLLQMKDSLAEDVSA